MAETNESKNSRTITSVTTTTILKVVAVILGIYFLYLVRDIILLVLISVILSAALTPLVNWFYARVRFPRGLTVVLVYILFIGVVVLVGSFAVPQLINELVSLSQNLELSRTQISQQGSQLYHTLDGWGLSDSLKSMSSTFTDLASGIFEKTLGVFTGLFDAVAVLVISFYLVIQQDGMKDIIKLLTPAKYHSRISGMVYKTQMRLGQWLLGQLTLMVMVFALSYAGLLALGVKNALILASIAGLLEVVPYLGPILSAVPAAFMALLQSPLLALAVIILYVLIQQIENYILAPRVLGKSVGANPVVILIALLVGFKIAGVIGAVIAPAVVAIATVILEDYNGYKKELSGSDSERT